MDTADDIAYAIHDLEDFHRVGVLQQTGVATELTGWAKHAGEYGPGSDLERLRRRLRDKDGWAYDDDAFAAAVARVRDDLVDGLLAVPFDGSMAGERAVAEFSARWTSRLVAGVTVGADPPVRSAHVALATAQWHEVAVLKFVHQRFVLRRADLASHQRGQATVLAALVDALTAWLAEDGDGPRLPPRLHDLVELSRGGARRHRARPRPRGGRLRRLAHRRPGHRTARRADRPLQPPLDRRSRPLTPRPRTHPAGPRTHRRDRGLTAARSRTHRRGSRDSPSRKRDSPSRKRGLAVGEMETRGAGGQPRVPVASRPPSIRTVSPVIHDASSDTRNPTSAATSSGFPRRFIGYAALILSSPSA